MRYEASLGLASGCLALALLLVLLTPAMALAHAYPVRSEPAPNATVATAPTAVQISFTEDLEPRLSDGEVYDARSRPVSLGASAVDPRDPHRLSIPLQPNLPAGTYTVVWHVVSADDGHSTAGVFAFGVGEPAAAPVVSPAQLGAVSGAAATPLGVAGRFLVYLAAALILGSAALVLLLRPSRALQTRLERPVLAGFALLLVGQVLRLADEVSLAGSAPVPGSAGDGVGAVLLDSRFGALWLARLALVVAGLALAAVPARRLAARWRWRGWLLVGLGLATDLTASGHAAAGNLLAYARLIQSTLAWGTRAPLYLPAAAALVHLAQPLTLLVDWLHLVATAVWVGGVLALALVVSPHPLPPPPRGGEGAYVARFSRLAVVAMVVVLVTGLYNTWLYLAGPASYVETGYGESLLLKHLAIVGLVLAAAVNRVVTVPLVVGGRVSGLAPAWTRRLLAAQPQWGLRLEGGLALVVLLSTGLLTSLGPARDPAQVLLDPARELSLEAEPLRASLRFAGQREVALELNPGRVGPNAYQVTVQDEGRPAADVERAYLELTPLGLAAGEAAPAASVVELTPSGPGRFVGRGLAPSADGLWKADVRAYFRDGSIGTASLAFQATAEWAAAADPDAIGMLADAARAMAEVRAARMIESLGNGAGGLVLDEYAFAAPDRQEVVNPSGEAVRQVGPAVYVRDPTSGAWREESGAPIQWPDGTYDYLTQGVGAVLVGWGDVLGNDCAVVAFYSPRVSGVYEEWIGVRDHRIHREIMAAPSHFMVNLYYDFDAPVAIMAPGAR